uniref:F-box domain-containing protein n=1 Tax=Oryza rufipogon TaxID=4529 RepID=A0A0E0NVW9_ORYRU
MEEHKFDDFWIHLISGEVTVDKPAMDDDDHSEFLDLVCDDLLELILLRLDSSTTLARAASVCKRWRRVIACDAFLRRVRPLHPPTIAGHYCTGRRTSFNCEGPAAFVPSPSLSARGRSLFSPEFIPSDMRVIDSCGGLLLLGWRDTFQRLAVCEPAARLRRRLHPAAVPEVASSRLLGAHLLPGDDGAAATGATNFKVVYTFQRRRDDDDACHSGVLMVTSVNGDSSGWSSTTLDERLDHRNFVGRAGGSLYWLTGDGAVHVLDGGTSEMTTHAFPDTEMWDCFLRREMDPGRRTYHDTGVRVVDGGGGGGAATMVCVAGHSLEVLAKPHDGGGEWAPVKSVRLPQATRHLRLEFNSRPVIIVAAAAGFVVFKPHGDSKLLFRVDLETEQVVQLEPGVHGAAPQFTCELPWPPPLHACVDEHANY